MVSEALLIIRILGLLPWLHASPSLCPAKHMRHRQNKDGFRTNHLIPYYPAQRPLASGRYVSAPCSKGTLPFLQLLSVIGLLGLNSVLVIDRKSRLSQKTSLSLL